MAKKSDVRKILGLYKKYSKLRNSKDCALHELIRQIEFVTGKEIQYNEFPGDGLGIAAGDRDKDTYMSFAIAFDIIKEKGTLDENEFTYL